MKLKLDKLKAVPAKIKSIKIRQFNWTTLLAMMCYLHILVIVPLVMSKNKPKTFISFHAKQGLLLLALVTLLTFTFYIPGMIWIVAAIYAALVLFGLIDVTLGRERKLPVIGALVGKL